MKNYFEYNKENISEQCMDIRDYLNHTKADYKEVQQSVLLLEEIGILIFANELFENNCRVKVISRFGSISLCVEYEGDEYNPLELIDEWDENDEEANIRHHILCAYQKRLSYNRKNRKNQLYIQVHEESKKSLYLTLIAMVLGLLAGQILKVTVPTITMAIDTNILNVVKTLFLNALKMMIAPVVFFSIASSVSSITNASEVGKMAVKILGLYFFTTCVAIVVGFAISQVSCIGELNVNTDSFATEYSSVETFDISFRDMLVGIIPSNLVDPIAKGDMIQIMFISVIVGIAASMLGEKIKLIQDLITSGNMLSLQIVKIIMRFIPFVSFCSMASMMINLGVDSLVIILRIMIAFLVGSAIMIILYTLMFDSLTKLPAGQFLKKIISFIPTPFSLASSNATIPASMEFCEKRLGIASKISSFSIPMGAVVNMDGSCVYIVICTCMFLKIYHIDLTLSLAVTIAVMTFVLSVGAPGVAGSAFICLSTIISSLGLPIGCIGMLVGIDSFFSMCRGVLNVTGDISISAIVAKSEHMLDENIFFLDSKIKQ